MTLVHRVLHPRPIRSFEEYRRKGVDGAPSTSTRPGVVGIAQIEEKEGGGVTADHQSATTTEITVVGANCPWCLNETIDRLRAEPGVVRVESTMSGQCLRIDHEQVEVHELLELIRRHLHAIGFSAAETVMVEIDPRVAELGCRHRRPADADDR